MPITRAKATALLNQREMALYDDSRANAIRDLDEKALSVRISRARDLRDRARDLVQRQKLSSRDTTGHKRGTSGVANQRSKDKVELTADILRRFEAQLDKVAAADTGTGRKAAKKKATGKAAKTPARKSASRRADRRDARMATRDAKRSAKAVKPARKKAAKTAAKPATKTPAAGTPAGRAKKPAKPAGAKKATARKASSKTSQKTAPGKPAKRLTPKQAAKRTRKLLEAKQRRDRAPKPWQTLDGGASTPGQPGYQSGAAARRALELHAGESRMPAIKGSISTRDRINQGKRDSRSGD